MAEAMSSGGRQTTRLPTTEEDLRDERRRDARGNLAAMMCERQAGAPSVRGLARPEKERIERAALEAVQAQPQLQRGATEEWALLLEALGLDVVPRGKPGICRRLGCDRPLPMASASTSGSPSRPHWRQGYCSLKCWTED